MSQQPVSNEFPLILPVPIVMMFSLLCFNKVSGRTYLQAKRVSSFHHMNKSSRPEAERSEFARLRKIQHRHRGRRPRCLRTSEASNGVGTRSVQGCPLVYIYKAEWSGHSLTH